MGAQESRFSGPLDSDVEAEAQRLARILLGRQGESECCQRFEAGLAHINAQLAKPRAARKLAVIERLQKTNARVVRHFRGEVEVDPDGARATSVC